MDYGVLQRIFGVNGDRMPCVGLVRRWCLEPLTAVWAQNQYGLTVMKSIEAFEEVDPPERNPLSGTAGLADVDDFLEPTEHPSPRIRLPSQHIRLRGDTRSLKVLGDSLMISEDLPCKLHRAPADLAKQRVFSQDLDLALPPRQQGGGHHRGWRGLIESLTSLLEIVSFPAGSEDSRVADHLEMLVGDMADQTPDEGQHRQGLVGDLAAFRIILVAEAHGLLVVVGNAILGENSAFGITPLDARQK